MAASCCFITEVYRAKQTDKYKQNSQFLPKTKEQNFRKQEQKGGSEQNRRQGFLQLMHIPYKQSDQFCYG
jgi:hypothetical protein